MGAPPEQALPESHHPQAIEPQHDPEPGPLGIDLSQPFPPWIHTDQDTPRKVPPDWIRQNAMTYALLLLRMLTDRRPLPTRRKTPREVRALVAKEGVAESLGVLGFDLGSPPAGGADENTPGGRRPAP